MVLAKDGVKLYAERAGEGDLVVVPQRIYLREYFEATLEGHTAVFYDPRNRGLSETITEEEKLSRGVWHDVDDLEAIRLDSGFEKMAILAHSYIGVSSLLFAAARPERVSRIVLIGPPGPEFAKVYPPELRSSDGGLEAFQQKFADLQLRMSTMSPVERCLEAWDLLKKLYVIDPISANDLRWAPCDVPNELNFMIPFTKYVMPSLTGLRWSEDMLARIKSPVLILHGRKDRSAPYGGGRDWAQWLPNARLVTMDEAAHVPWIEAPETVYGAIRTFLNGAWPETAEDLRR